MNTQTQHLLTYLQIGHDGTEPGSGWLVREIELDVPTKGKHYIFTCKQWLAKDKSDGKTSRLLHVADGQSSMTAYKPSKWKNIYKRFLS